jgi:hypothetical protein
MIFKIGVTSPHPALAGEKEFIMNTTITLNQKEVSSLSICNARRYENGQQFLKMNPTLDESDEFYQRAYTPFGWNEFRLDESNTWVDPIVLDTHGVEPFPENQGTVKFKCMGKLVLNALEPSPYTGGSFHVLVPGASGNWDYARTMTNMSWDKHEEDPAYINTRDDIDPDAIYEVEMHGGCGYVYIHQVSDPRKEE